jgi:hypothetical protein
MRTVRGDVTVTIATYYWKDSSRRDRGYEFNPEHIRIWASMVNRHCSVPHRTVCVTDEPISVDGVETIPMDWSKHVTGTICVRLMQHSPAMHSVLGDRVLSLDLDIVITGSIDHIVTRREEFIIFRNPNFPAPGRSIFQGSIQLLTPGARRELYDDFDPVETPKYMNWRFGGKEQAWIAERLEWTEATFDSTDGVYGAGRLGDWNDSTVVDVLPANACIVTFPGAREPSQPEVQAKHKWVQEHYW